MRITICNAVGAFLILLCACSSASAMMCKDMEDDRFKELKDLYKYAGIAEVPEHVDVYYTEDCIGKKMVGAEYKKDTIVEVQKITKIYIPQEFINELRDRHDGKNAIFWPTRWSRDGRIVEFVSGCQGKNEYKDIFLGFKLVLRSSERDWYHIITKLVTWGSKELTSKPVEDESGGTMIVFPGTELGDLAKIFANFGAEDCVLPRVGAAVEIFCNVLRSKEGSVYNAFVKLNGDKEFPRDSSSLTMIGHSLGGSVTQFTALNLPEECLPSDNFNEFRAFAFVSPGLKNEKPESTNQGKVQLPNERIFSVSVDGDTTVNEKLEFIFSEHFQIGRVAVFMPQDSDELETRHTIVEVQKILCSCLQGEGSVHYDDGSFTNEHIKNIFAE